MYVAVGTTRLITAMLANTKKWHVDMRVPGTNDNRGCAISTNSLRPHKTLYMHVKVFKKIKKIKRTKKNEYLYLKYLYFLNNLIT